MLALLDKIVEIAFARVAPGLLNLCSIVLLGHYLSAADYGLFSTVLATTGLIALLATGPVRLSIVPRRAASEASGKERVFEQSVLSMLLLGTGGLFLAGVTFWLADIVRFEWVALACSSALFNGWVPVLQARLQVWRFGLVALVNAFTIMGVILVVVSADPTVTNTIFAYALGNVLGFGVGWTICGLPRPGGVDFSQARNIMEIGTTLTLSSFAESGLFLGIRYVIFLFGSYEFLGIFSFAVDLAQRSVGVVINITAFAVVPKAYQGSASNETGNFFNVLQRGGFVAISLSGLAFATILVIKKFGWFDILSNGQFLLPVFTAVSVAIIVNRLKKMILDPIAVENKVVLALPVGYIFVMPVALTLATWCARHGFEMVIAYIYALAYFSAACFSAVIIWFRSRKATCYRNR